MTAALILTCIMGWGLWCVFESRAVASIGPLNALSVSLAVYAAAAMALLAVTGRKLAAAPSSGLLWAGAASLCSIAAIVGYLLLVRRTENHLASAITAIYPVVPALWSVTTGVSVGARDWAGIVMCGAGAVLLSWR